MRYPNKLVELKEGIALYIPDSEMVKTTYEGLLANNAATVFPFWAKIWPAAKAIADFLGAELPYIKNKRVIEIGAGIGLPSFAIAQHTAEIIISDYATEAVELIEKNIDHLGLTNTKAMCLDWNDFPTNIKADIVLLSDINYAPNDFNALQNLIQRFLAQGSTIIISTPERITASPFVEKINMYIKSSTFQTIENGLEQTKINILILKL
jgi:predicted nicotinamide N-methyase